MESLAQSIYSRLPQKLKARKIDNGKKNLLPKRKLKNMYCFRRVGDRWRSQKHCKMYAMMQDSTIKRHYGVKTTLAELKTILTLFDLQNRFQKYQPVRKTILEGLISS